jgi:hypothetical protein
MKTFIAQQRSHLSVVHHALSANKSIFLRLLAVVLISIVMMGQAFAANDNNDLNRNFAGLYVGGGIIATDEHFTLQLSKDGAVRAISGQEPRPGYEFFTERESTSLGEWRKTGPNSIEFAIIQYRYGDFLCSEFSGDLIFENCTLVFVATATISKNGELQGDGVITILDRSSGGRSFELPDFPIELQKKSIDDLKAMGSLP